jgi:hypothetical protein
VSSYAECPLAWAYEDPFMSRCFLTQNGQLYFQNILYPLAFLVSFYPNVPLSIYIISGLDILVTIKAQLLFQNILYQLVFLVSSYV